jgi:DNA-binding LacI/PurR family transcriptional regulator
MNYIAVDNHAAAFNVVDHLIKLGHTQIATVAGDISTQAGLRRLDGYHQALQERNIQVPRTYVTFGEFLRTPARAAAKKLLKLKDRPTAVFAASDVMALEVLDEAREAGIRVPEELSVIGFDDNPLSTTGTVKLTTVSQPLVEMGRLGAENLYLISRGKVKLPLKMVLPTKLVKRQSASSVAGATKQ